MSEAKEVPKNSCEIITSSLFMSTLELFNGVPTKTLKKREVSKKLIEDTIDHGFMFTPQVAGNYTDKQMREMIDIISDQIGLTPTQMNSSFHKSWKKVRDAPFGQLLAEQIFHYMTVYGYDSMGVYDEATVYIPQERLDIPAVEGDVKLALIKGYTKKELKTKILKLINSGIALEGISPVIVIAMYVGLTEKEVMDIKNKEVRVRMYNHLDLIPEDPVELLRLAIYETTGKTLLITNNMMINEIKNGDNDGGMVKLFEQYDENFGYKRLAEIFRRFKRIFLAFKKLDNMVTPINRIGHLSDKYHKPMPQSMLNNITGMLKRNEKIDEKLFTEKLGRVNIWRKIRLAQSLSYRMLGNKSIMYKVRNGKAYASEMDFDNIQGAKDAYHVVLKSIAKDLKHLKGKEFYIPENLTYALPATEKQFSGNIPSGSYYTIGKDMIFGIYWENVDGYTDLDLHSQALNAGHIGWNAQYRTANRAILFSGDITDAPNGATELFYINKDYDDTVLITLNYYNYREDTPVPFKFMFAEEHTNALGANYTINPDNIKGIINTEISVQQRVLGLATVKDGECRFYFSEFSLGNTRAIRGGGKYMGIARDYLANYATNQVTLNEVLERVGATIVTKPTKKSVDLSPENLQKDTFINLLIKP